MQPQQQEQVQPRPSRLKRIAKGTAALGLTAAAGYGAKKVYDSNRSGGGKTRDRIFGRRAGRALKGSFGVIGKGLKGMGSGLAEQAKTVRPYRTGAQFAEDTAQKKEAECLK